MMRERLCWHAATYIFLSLIFFLTFFKWLSLKLTTTEKHDKHKYSSREWRKSYIFIHMFSCHRCQHVNIPALPNSNKTTPFPKALMALQTAIMLQMERPGGWSTVADVSSLFYHVASSTGKKRGRTRRRY